LIFKKIKLKRRKCGRLYYKEGNEELSFTKDMTSNYFVYKKRKQKKNLLN
jgi:hypothetical protein